jgi:hypothetical protein
MYGTVANWIIYAALRGNVVANDAASAQALQRASDYIRTRYVLRLAPAYDADSEATIEATYIAASYDLASPGFWAKTFTPSQTKVLTKAGDISWTPVSSMGHTSLVDAMLPTSPAIDALFFGAQIALGPRLV